MLPRDLTKDLKDRLSGIKGQVEGIIRMLDESDDPAQILNQFKAVNKGFEKAQHLLLDEVFRKTLAMKIAEALEACPGNCGQEEKIAIIRNQFPDLELYELTDKMKEIEKIYGFLRKNNNNIMKEISFTINNMVCQGCAEKIADVLNKADGVQEVKTKAMKKMVHVKYNTAETNENNLIVVLTEAGYKPMETLSK